MIIDNFNSDALIYVHIDLYPFLEHHELDFERSNIYDNVLFLNPISQEVIKLFFNYSISFYYCIDGDTCEYFEFVSQNKYVKKTIRYGSLSPYKKINKFSMEQLKVIELILLT